MNLKAIEIQKKKLRTTFRKQFGGGRSIGLWSMDVLLERKQQYDLPSFGLVKTEKVSGFSEVGPLYP